MAKKVTKVLKAELHKTLHKGGAWLCDVQVFDVMSDGTLVMEESVTSAWSNPSAAKRQIKVLVQTMTPRKSVKMIAGENLDEKGKPTSFTGELTYKV
jgi:hypothetical protein